MSRQDPSLAPGASFEGRYEILAKLGEGGFGAVHKARQLTTGQMVALKIMRLPEQGGAARAGTRVARFLREAQLSAQLHHPNIVQVVDSGQTADGSLYTVFAFVPGDNLAEVIAREGALAPHEARHLMLQVLDALACAHAAGVIHRDLKPSNIMVVESGARRNALVLDFGIGTMIDGTRGEGRAHHRQPRLPRHARLRRAGAVARRGAFSARGSVLVGARVPGVPAREAGVRRHRRRDLLPPPRPRSRPDPRLAGAPPSRPAPRPRHPQGRRRPRRDGPRAPGGARRLRPARSLPRDPRRRPRRSPRRRDPLHLRRGHRLDPRRAAATDRPLLSRERLGDARRARPTRRRSTTPSDSRSPSAPDVARRHRGPRGRGPRRRSARLLRPPARRGGRRRPRRPRGAGDRRRRAGRERAPCRARDPDRGAPRHPHRHGGGWRSEQLGRERSRRRRHPAARRPPRHLAGPGSVAVSAESQRLLRGVRPRGGRPPPVDGNGRDRDARSSSGASATHGRRGRRATARRRRWWGGIRSWSSCWSGGDEWPEEPGSAA